MSNKIYLGSTNLGNGKIRLGANDVSAIYLGANKVYGYTTPPIPINDLLCFTANTANSSVSFYNYGTNPVLYYSADNGSNWNLWDGTAITLSNVGDKVYFYGTNPNGISSSGTDYSKFETPTGSFTLSGNVMSLIDYTCPNTIPNTYCFAYLFKDTYITSIANFSLPATTLTEKCYAYMFRGCSHLVTVPSGLLPATTLATGCYFNMFTNCTSITSLPNDFLPATTLAPSCYYFMFAGCTGLVVAPDLMAQTLVQECYGEMFYGCSSLNSVKCLATSISATDCTVSWLSNVAQSGTFYKSSVPNWTTGASGIPTGWTTQDVYNCADDWSVMGYTSEAECACSEDGDYMGDGTLGDCMCNEFNECIDCSTDYSTLGYSSEEECNCEVYGNDCEEPDPCDGAVDYSDCNYWECFGYSDYEDCDCRVNQNCGDEPDPCQECIDACEGDPDCENDCVANECVEPDPCEGVDCSDCSNWDSGCCGWESYEDCDCQVNGNCPEEEEEPEEEPEP